MQLTVPCLYVYSSFLILFLSILHEQGYAPPPPSGPVPPAPPGEGPPAPPSGTPAGDAAAAAANGAQYSGANAPPAPTDSEAYISYWFVLFPSFPGPFGE